MMDMIVVRPQPFYSRYLEISMSPHGRVAQHQTSFQVPTISRNAVDPEYGDRITGSVVNVPGGQFSYGDGGEGFTPNIVTDYFADSAIPNNPGVSLWRDQYGDLTNVLIGNNNSISLNVQLTAGYRVRCPPLRLRSGGLAEC